MTQQELKDRTKRFALLVVKLIEGLPNSVAGRAIANQLIRSGTSIGANYRAACRGRSKKEFISKLGIVLEEADESEFWLEMIIDSKIGNPELAIELRKEIKELIAIFTKSILTSKRNT